MRGDKVGALVFLPGETGFVFSDDRGPHSGRCGEPGRTWAFSTIGEAAAWLTAQIPPDRAPSDPGSAPA